MDCSDRAKQKSTLSSPPPRLACAEARNSIGTILVACMFIGTLFPLFVLPSVYLWLAGNYKAEEGLEAVKGARGINNVELLVGKGQTLRVA